METKLNIDIQSKTELLSHPPYYQTLLLATMPISMLNGDLKGRNFGNVSDLKLAVNEIISSYDPEWFKSVFKLYLGAPVREKCPRERRIR